MYQVTSNGLNAVCQKSDVIDAVTSIIDECLACNISLCIETRCTPLYDGQGLQQSEGEIARDRFRFINIVARRIKITDNEKTLFTTSKPKAIKENIVKRNKHNAIVQ